MARTMWTRRCWRARSFSITRRTRISGAEELDGVEETITFALPRLLRDPA